MKKFRSFLSGRLPLQRLGLSLRPLRLRRDERWPSLVWLAALLWMQGLMVYKFHTLFAHPTGASWTQFMRNFRMSGFDPTVYAVVLHWHQGFDVLRHPLLAYMLWPLSMLNRGLSACIGTNCVQYVTGLLLVGCAYVSLLLLWRTLRFVEGTGRLAGWLLATMYMGFAYVAVSMAVPDHFCLSMPLLALTLYMAGRKMKRRQTFTPCQAAVLFTAVAGVTLSNGIVVLLAVALTNGRTAFCPRFLAALLLPALLLLGTGLARRMPEGRAAEAVGQQMKWTRHNLNRADVVTENMLGEGLQLHRRYILGDVLSGRPVIVRYSWPAQYGAEALIAGLALWGAWAGRRRRFQWLAAGVLVFNLLLHVGLGFALDEVHIMTAHWAMVLPLSMGWLAAAPPGSAAARQGRRRMRPAVLCAVAGALALYLWLYHGVLLWRYLTWPLVP